MFFIQCGMKNFFLSDVKLNTQYTIASICDNIDIKIKTRLLEFGFFCGQKIIVRNKSLRKGVLLVELKNQMVSLRKEEASCVVVYG